MLEVKKRRNKLRSYLQLITYPHIFLSSCPPAFPINITLKIYELTSPSERTIPSELISLNPANPRSAKENTVVIQDIKTASADFLFSPNLNTE